MIKNPLVSVIMGVAHRSENIEMLSRAVKSIQNQSYKNIELIICTKRCSQNTEKFLKKTAKLDNRVVLLDGSGLNHLGGQLNLCIEYAQGDFIARMDDDDFSYPHRFAKQLYFLATHKNIAFVGSNVRLIRDKNPIGTRKFPQNPLVKDFLFTQPFIHPTLMFRRECLTAVGGYSDEDSRRGCEDYDLLLRLYEANFCGANVYEFLLDYSLPPKGFTHRTFSLRINEMKTRKEMFSRLKLMPMALPYVLKPIVAGMLPTIFLDKLKACREKYYDTKRMV